VDMITKLATSFGFLLNLSESKYEVTAIGVVNCKIKTAAATSGRFKAKATLTENKRQINVLKHTIEKPLVRFVSFKRATDTPNVINIRGIAI
tara:strand:+ start:292 stop:567 length:276 start_codon:yes stop_codon:yes gene_type:complete